MTAAALADLEDFGAIGIDDRSVMGAVRVQEYHCCAPPIAGTGQDDHAFRRNRKITNVSQAVSFPQIIDKINQVYIQCEVPQRIVAVQATPCWRKSIGSIRK